jgi:hypothetical protein
MGVEHRPEGDAVTNRQYPPTLGRRRCFLRLLSRPRCILGSCRVRLRPIGLRLQGYSSG